MLLAFKIISWERDVDMDAITKKEAIVMYTIVQSNDFLKIYIYTAYYRIY